MKKLLGILLLWLSSWTVADDVPDTVKPGIRSLDYCSDQYVLALGAGEQVTALSIEATMRHSYYREAATGILQRSLNAENILRDSAEVIVRSWAGDARLQATLKRAGRQVETIGYGSDPDSVAGNLRYFGKLFGRDVEAEGLIAGKLATLNALKAAGSTGKSALYITSGGFMAGTGTDIDRVLRLAGYRNAAADYGFSGWLPIPLEHLVMDPPEVFVTGFFDTRDPAWFNWSLVRHPGVVRLLDSTPTIEVPGGLLSCGGLFQMEAAAYIRREAGK